MSSSTLEMSYLGNEHIAKGCQTYHFGQNLNNDWFIGVCVQFLQRVILPLPLLVSDNDVKVPKVAVG
jgi:hypothetical protein